MIIGFSSVQNTAALAGVAAAKPAMATSAIRKKLLEKIVLLRKRLLSAGSRDN
jgi:hypothetical protein